MRDSLFLYGFVLCNDAVLGEEERRGDPTELALLDMAARCGIFKEQLEEKLPRVGELAFDSERKMMSTAHRGNGEGISYTKGSPDEILARCRTIWMDGAKKPLTPSVKKQIRGALWELTGKGSGCWRSV